MRFLLIGLYILAFASACKAETWPRLRDFHMSVGITWNVDRIDIDIPLFDESGNIAYRLICRGGKESYLDKLSEGPNGINYVGPLMCILNEGNEETELSLLADANDRGGPWHTRGQYFMNQLVGACGDYPQYGRVRTFKLRGFELTLDLSESSGDDARLAYSVMKIVVKKNLTIRSRRAELSEVAEPSETCSR